MVDEDVSLNAFRTIAAFALMMLMSSVAHADRIDDTIALLKARSFKVRVQAALILGTERKHPQRVLSPLSAALRDRHRAVRAAAAMALGRLGNPEALSALDKASADHDRTVQQHVQKAINRIVKGFRRSLGRFDNNRFLFGVRFFKSPPGKGGGDALTEALMRHLDEHTKTIKNVDFRANLSFEDSDTEKDVRRIANLDLSGRIVAISPKKCTIQLILSLYPSGYVVKKWGGIKASGKIQKEAIERVSKAGWKKVLGFLGKRVK